jgi:hypothetical protein
MNLNVRRLASLAGSAAMLAVLASNVAAASPAKLTALPATDNTGTPAAGTAWIRVLHASPDAPAVDVYVDGAKAITGLAFGQIAPTAAPGYVPVPAGNHAIKVCATGSTTVCPIDVPALAVADGKRYTIAATNVLAQITAQVIEDGAAPNADAAQVRVVHFSADTPAVDVYVNGSKAVTALAYPKATGYLSLPGGDYAVKVCATGSTTVCPIDVPKLTVANGTAYSVFAIGSLDALLATPAPSATPTPTEAPSVTPTPTEAPSVTPPPTDTVAGTTGTPGNSLVLVVLALVFIAALAFGLARPLAARRARR